MSIDPAIRDWLQAAAMQSVATDATIAARYPTQAIESEITSPIATSVDAQAEAARQLAFFSGPMVKDIALVTGARSDLLGRAITMTADRLGYPAGLTCWVIAAEELEDVDMTQLTILRRLA